MSDWLTTDELHTIRSRMEGALRHLRLPFRNQVWKGMAGSWVGAGTGSSIDFQDHRPYLPGDDPRYIDWQAYARSGNYSMKLYREEVSPCVDLILDSSASMWLHPEKRDRAIETLYFCCESAWVEGAFIRAYLCSGSQFRPLDADSIRSGKWTPLDPLSGEPPETRRIPLRSGSLRVLISDLLFPHSPAEVLRPLAERKGRGVVLSPFSQSEASPNWEGNLEFIDCETDAQRRQLVNPAINQLFVEAYKRHFSAWRDEARRFSIVLARIPSDPDFVDAMRWEAVPSGAIELSA